ncbi:OmpP1/FadL family transporter [Halocynthiibacter namhaensis]|uniref:OmpP1/FadL family transporter n=1 Tax=Halocynthiibacter namhaensis TaxID=1290553 RepID=UPI0005791C2F|nr:outer membrane protein transport protein [Halocynthiibacter namhaensis]
MNKLMSTAALLALTSTGALAGGIDRSGQGVGIIFEEGNRVELSFGTVSPTASGVDVANQPTGNVASSFTQASLAYRRQLTDSLSLSLIADSPFGADVSYGPTSPVLGGTFARADSTSVSGILRYKMSDRFSVHGGIRAQQASAEVTLNGAAYGPVAGYNVKMDQDIAYGYTIGAAYEIPDIALRVALTYHSEIDHSFQTTESIGPSSVTKVTTPKSINLDFQSGISQNTLLFGQIRWVDWSALRFDPAAFVGATGGGLIDLEDSTTYTLGVGRKFNDSWSGAVSITYEDAGKPLVSPLAPTTGKLGLTLAGVYTEGNTELTIGVNYTKLGDAQPETGTPDVARASFSGNSAIGVGVKLGIAF